jgi:hypothetical protein
MSLTVIEAREQKMSTARRKREGNAELEAAVQVKTKQNKETTNDDGLSGQFGGGQAGRDLGAALAAAVAALFAPRAQVSSYGDKQAGENTATSCRRCCKGRQWRSI